MNLARLCRCAALATCAAALSACGMFGSAMIPDEPGLYAVIGDGELQRLDGPADWERETWPIRSDLRPDVRFVVAHPSLIDGTRPIPEAIHLRKVAWLRSDIGVDGTVAPVEGSKWVAPSLAAFAVPLEFAAFNERGDVIEATPLIGDLEPGLYALELRTGAVQANGRLGVGWRDVDKSRYASAHCVDRYATDGVSYRRCSEQTFAGLVDGLEVHLVDPEKRSVGDRQILLVRGVVVNRSDAPRRIPALRAVLRDGQGQALYSWPFRAPAGELAPARSVSFQTSTDRMVGETASVLVELAPEVIVKK